MLYKETVEDGTLDLIKRLMKDRQLDGFDLVGGTNLALRMGHRKSVDIDLFTSKPFDATALAAHISANYPAEIITVLKNAIFCYVEGVKTDIIAHQYPLVEPVETIAGIRLLSPAEIGAMKLNAILYNGKRLKDFADMYFLLEGHPLKKMTDVFIQKYPDANKAMVHNALLYHAEINHQVKIDFLQKQVPWDDMAKRLNEAVMNENRIFPKTSQSQDNNQSQGQGRRRR